MDKDATTINSNSKEIAMSNAPSLLDFGVIMSLDRAREKKRFAREV